MKRQALVRTAVSVTTVTAALTLGLGAAGGLAGQAYAAGAAEVRIPATDYAADPSVSLVATTFDGELFQVEGTAGYLWTDNANGATKAVPALDGVPRSSISTMYDAYNRVAYSGTGSDGSTTITLVTVTTGAQTTLTVPSEDENPVAQGGFAVATRTAEDGSREYRIVRTVDGKLSDYPVLLPDGATAEAAPVVLSGSNTHFVLRWQQDGQAAYGIVDEITGTVRALPVTGEASSFVLSDSWVSWFSRQDTAGVRVMAAGNPSATPSLVPITPQSATSDVHAFMVGSNVVWYDEQGGPLHLEPLAGADTARVVLPEVEQALPGRDGGIIVLGRNAAGVRGIHQLIVDGSGLAGAYLRHTVDKITFQGAVTGLTLDRGNVRVQNTVHGMTSRQSEGVGLGRTPQSSNLVAVENVTAAEMPEVPGRFVDGGDEGSARLVVDPVTQHDTLVTFDDNRRIALPTKGGRILGASPQYVLYEAGDDQHRQYVVDIVQNKIVRDLAAQASALDYSTLWTPSPTQPGTLVDTDLRTGSTAGTLALGSDCTPDDLRDNGQLLYWSCADQDKAGVIDVATGEKYAAPVGDVLLGDGFMAAYDPASHALHLSSLEDGVVDSLGDITGLKTTTAADTRGMTWTVDPRSNKVAYVDTADTVHVVAAYVTASLASQLAYPDRSVPASFAAPGTGGTGAWNPRWWLSKPVSSWQLTITNPVDLTEARFFSGGTATRSIGVAWDGTTAGGDPLSGGTYTWQLTAQAADGTGQSAVTSGTVTMTGRAAVAGALFGRDTAGVMWQYRSTGNATTPYANRVQVGGGWQGYTALTSLSGQGSDGNGDLVARDATGTLWYYSGTGNPSAPLATRVKVGTGWNIYDVLTGAGDLTGDGRADLVARDTSGVLWLYRATGATTFASRTQIGGGWNTYDTLVRANDVTGDGRSDLVARDASGVLWLYRGTGNAAAPYATRTRIVAGWNLYDILAGANDVTGDGRADLVARDTSGVLWLYRGTGNAAAPYADRTRIVAGWNLYNTLL
ncbi:FG-GAP repeat domain-containing protein [Streptomyces sp. NPDC049040]|uniref:FG-GAP repeat domain-containing protein n=1 Tax=Streptomyces sp. NPDC049040 TaxID=3365593 RepID=UPI00371A4B5F